MCPKGIFKNFFVVFSIFLGVFFAENSIVFAGNPVAPIQPSDNIQDPGDPGTAWGGCGPSDSNCYVTVSGDLTDGDKGDITVSGTGSVWSIDANSITLGTDTTGDYVASFTAGAGLTGSASGEASTPTLAVVSNNGGIVVNADDIALTLTSSADALSATTSSGSGLQVLSSGLTLLQGCSDGQILKWNETSDVWACGSDATGGGAGNSFETIGTPAGTSPVADSATDTLTLTVTGTNFSITGDSSADSVTFDLVESVLAGSGLVANGSALDIQAGNGIQISSDSVALGALASNWSQTGAFDIVLDNASSELQILESAGGAFYGTLDVGDLSANATYTFSGTSATVLTSANYTSTLDSVYVNVGESPAAGDITGSFSGGLTVGANAVTLTTDTVGDYVAYVTAGAGLTGSASGEASTPTLAVVSNNGGIVVNADDIALTLTSSADALSATTSSGSGLQVLSSGLTLLQGCSDGQILKWNETSDVWACAADASGGGGLSDGDYGDIIVSGSGSVFTIDADIIDWADIADATTLDASTSIGFGASTFNFTFTNDGSGNEIHNLSSTGDFVIQDNGTAFVTFDDSGNSTFEGAVVFNEAGADKDLRIEGDTNSNLIFVDASTDAVGIGTGSPTSIFEVSHPSNGPGTVTTNGTTTLTGTNTTFKTTFKVGATITVSGETSRTITAIASDTSLTVTVAFSTSSSGLSYTVGSGRRFAVGSSQIFIGSLTAGVGNGIGTSTVFGIDALRDSTSLAYQNDAFGYAALRDNTNGRDNTGFGAFSLANNETGVENVALGRDALFSTISGNGNVGIGTVTLYDLNASGGYNTAVGNRTGRGITTGSYNTIIGAGVSGLSSSLSNTVIIADGQADYRFYSPSSGNILLGTTTDAGAYKLQVVKSTTGQTAEARVINASNASATFDTTAGTLSSYGGYFSSTSTRSAGSNNLTNVGLYATASGAQNNYAALFEAGNVGIGDTSPAALFTVGSGDLFQVNSSGAIAAATGITSSGTINFSDLSASSAVYTDGSKNLTSTAPTSGTIGYWSRSSTTLSPATANDIVSISTNSTTASNKAIEGLQTGATTGTDYAGYFSNTGAATTNIGLYATASGASQNIAAFFENGSVGIGAYDPSIPLYINSSSATTLLKIFKSTGDAGISFGVEDLATDIGRIQGEFDNSPADLLLNPAGGNIGINTTAPTRKLDVVSGDNTASTEIATFSSNNLTQYTTLKYNALHQSGGYLELGKSDLSSAIRVGNGTNRMDFLSGGAYKAAIDANGLLVGASYANGGATAPSNGLAVQGETFLGSSTDAGSYILQATGNSLFSTSSTTDLNKTIEVLQTGATVGTDYAGYFSNTGAATTNVGLYATATGATNNYAAIFEAGNVGIGDTSPAALFTVGSGDLFQVNSSGAIAAATGITSSGIFNFTAGTTTNSIFNMTSTGDFIIQDNGTAVFTATDAGRLLFAPTAGQNVTFAFTSNNQGRIEVNAALYTSTIGAIDVVRSGNFTGTSGATAIELGIEPSLTVTEPGSGTFTWNGADIDFASVSVTAGAGTSVFNTLRLKGVSDADAGTVRGLFVDNLTSTAATETAVEVGTGWDTVFKGTTAGTNLFDFTNFKVTSAGVLSSVKGATITDDALTSGILLSLSSNGTAALNDQTGLDIALLGANATSGQTTYGAVISNGHTGTSSTNYGLYAEAINGVQNYGLTAIATGGTATLSNTAGDFTNGGAGTNFDPVARFRNTAATGYTQLALEGTGHTWTLGVGNASEAGVGVANDFFIYDYTNVQIPFAITEGGTVLIGSTTEVGGNKLEVTGDVLVTGNALYLSGDDASAGYDDQNRLGFTKKATAIPKLTYGSATTFTIAQSSGTGIDASNTFTDRFVIDTSGNVGIGDLIPDYLLDVANAGADTNIFALTDSDGECLYNPESGSVTVSCSSDERLKTGIIDAPSVLEYFNSFRVREYSVIASGDMLTGVIAQEVMQIHPELVTLGANGFYSVELPSQWKMVKAIQELDVKIESIKTLVDEPGGFLDNLRAWLADAANGVGDIVGGRLKAKDEICVGATCLTEGQLQELMQQAGMLGTASSEIVGSGEEGDTSGDPDTNVPDASQEEGSTVEEAPTEEQSQTPTTSSEEPAPEPSTSEAPSEQQ